QREYQIHERAAKHDKEFLPPRAKFVKFGSRNRFRGCILALERTGGLVAVEFDVGPERNGAYTIIRVAAPKSPDPRAKAEKRVCFDTHTKKFSHHEMAKFVNVDSDAKNDQGNKDVIKNYVKKCFHKRDINPFWIQRGESKLSPKCKA